MNAILNFAKRRRADAWASDESDFSQLRFLLFTKKGKVKKLKNGGIYLR
jgi:hypothetical protein